MIKILIATQEYPPRLGGAGVVAKQNAEGLALLGYDITVLTRDWGPESDNRKVKYVKVKKSFIPWHILFAKQFISLDLKQFDLIIINDIGAAVVFSKLFLSREILSKTIVYLHGGEPTGIFENPKMSFKLCRSEGSYIKLILSCRKIVAVSQYMKQYFLQVFPKPVIESKIEVVYAGIDGTVFRPKSLDLRKKYGIAPGNTLLLSVSRITQEKGYATMLDLFRKVIEQDPSFHWIVAGDGNYLKEFKEMYKRNGLESYITCTGNIDREKLPHYYTGADLFWLMTERKSESFGLVYAEAQSCGTPVLAPRSYGVIEAVKDKESGYLVNSEKECVDIILSKHYLHLEKSKIVSFAKTFHLSNQISNLETALLKTGTN